MNGYTKLFGSIVASTIWAEDDQTRIVWITMLAMANQHGEVESSVPGLAKFASVSIDATNAALAKLLAPDPYSRTKEHEGRRIAAIDGGWLILNHAKYREKASFEDRKEKDRVRQQRHRNNASRPVTDASRPVTDASRPVTECHDKQKQKQKQTDKALLSLSEPIKPTKPIKLTKREKAIADKFEAALTTQWVNDAGKWIGRIRADASKCERVISELESAIKEERIATTPAQYAEQMWKEFR